MAWMHSLNALAKNEKPKKAIEIKVACVHQADKFNGLTI
jgi:hypothetical protein